jgi:hypothetical protein
MPCNPGGKMRKTATPFGLTIFILILALMALTAYSDNSPVGGDLYKVQIESQIEAQNLSASPAIPIAALSDGYLVLVNPDRANDLTEAGLRLELLARDVSKEEIALDGRLDRQNVGKFELIYEDGNFRVFRIDPDVIASLEEPPQLVKLPSHEVPVIYREPSKINLESMRGIEDLQTLISNVSQDSLESYTLRLQAFFRRLAGSDSNYAARDWIESKFVEFGYDSIYIDTFQAYVGSGYTNCMNVVCTKVGTVKPDHHVIVGAHFDGVSSSPAADDNGSGTAGVLEISRILKDVQTDLTFVFILFDSEEQGLNGSYHYADNAAANGDSIVYMFNMDMIAHYENSNQAKLYHGSVLTYTELFAELADSLLGISSTYMGSSSGSDHYPFTVNGYEATFLHEYVFSTVYHSYQDSTTYMNFPYMTKMVKGGLATTYVVSQSYALPQVAFNFPAGLPSALTPGQPMTFDVDVYGVNNGIPVPNSGKLYYAINDGAFTAVAMNELLPNHYLATIPATDCGNRIYYYVSADEQDNGTFYDTDQPHSAVSATNLAISLQDNFELDKGWTEETIGATSGYWMRGVPVDDDSWDYDPASDADGSGQCFLTQNIYGNTDVDDGSVRLTSPVFDMSLPGTISYDYYLYLTNTEGGVDKLLVEANSDGGAGLWKTVAVHDQNGGLDWRHNEITEADLAAAGVALSTNMQIRFTANDADPQSIVEAGVDAFKVTQIQCYEEVSVSGLYLFEDTTTMVLIDNDIIIGELTYTEGDVSPLYEIWFFGESTGLYQPDTTYYSLAVETTDESVATAQVEGNWDIIVTANQPGMTHLIIHLLLNGEDYYVFLPITINIDPAYIVGDANADGNINVSDAVHIINYVFVGGQEPQPFESGDSNCDGSVNVSDAVMIINYVFVEGNTPGDPDGDGVPDC